MQIYWTTINEVIEETPNTLTYMLDCPDDFVWEEGAHTHLALEGFNSGDKPNKGLVRHMSICTLPGEKAIGITTRIREQRSEYKSILNDLQIGSKVALFKTHSNVPLRREDKNVYLLSSGVGIATFRPLVLEYLNNAEGVKSVHSVNVDSSKNYLFPEVFKTSTDKNLTSEFIDNRAAYYDKVKKLAEDNSGLFYVVGSDEFLEENIRVLKSEGINADQIMLDKRAQRKEELLK